MSVSRLLVLFTALMVLGDAHAQAPDRFAIESISIEGARYSSTRILLAESRLVEGQEYTERQLRDAMARIRRLPFILDAEFRLRKGSVRERYVLVIRVFEATPVFGLYESRYLFAPDGAAAEHHDEILTVGARLFVGSRGMITVTTEAAGRLIYAAGGERPRYGLAYTQYDLFGTRASLSVAAEYSESSFDFYRNAPQYEPGRLDSSFTDHLRWRATGALPLTSNQALRASWNRGRTFAIDDGEQRLLRLRRFHEDEVRLSWIYDTTANIIFPVEGTTVEAAATLSTELQTARSPLDGRAFTEPGWDSGIAVRAARHWELVPGHSLSGEAQIEGGRNNVRDSLLIRAGYSRNTTRRIGRQHAAGRLELQAERIMTRTGSGHNTAIAAMSFRNAWGVVRLDARYAGWGR